MLVVSMPPISCRYRGWFSSPAKEGWPEEKSFEERLTWLPETHWMLIVPALFTALLSLLAGLFAGTDLSPLAWGLFIVEREFAL